MKFILYSWLFLPFLLNGVTPSPGEAQTVPNVVVGYYPSWTDKLPVNQINFGQFTHLIHAFVTIKKGVLHTAGNLPSRALTEAGHAAGVKVLLGFGGADSGRELAAMTQNPATEEACIDGLAKLVADNGYDGVDIDWEFPTAADAANVVSFVERLGQALRKTNPAALVTMPLPSTDYYGQYFDGPQLARLIDFGLIMTYNAHGPWKIDVHNFCHAGFDSPLNVTDADPVDGNQYSYQKSVDYWRGKGFANTQLVIGIHLSGHGFMVSKWGETPLKASAHGDIEYRSTKKLIDQGWQRQWDKQAEVPWLVSPPGLPPELITYDDPESVELKGAWAQNAGLRGIFFWEISEDFIQGQNELVQAARKGIELPPDSHPQN
jgi:chitinase